MLRRFLFLTFLCVTATAVLSGCEDQYYPEKDTGNFYRLSTIEPPEQPQDDPAPYIDSPRDQIWRPGYWSYDSVNFVWVPGELLNKPSPFAVWAPDHWEHHNFGWAFVAGHWE